MFIKFETTGDKLEAHVTVEWKKLIAALKAAAAAVGIAAALYSTPAIQHLLAYLGF